MNKSMNEVQPPQPGPGGSAALPVRNKKESLDPSGPNPSRPPVPVAGGIILALGMAWLLVPPLATLAYAFAGTWARSILPETWTLEHFAFIFQDPRFWTALGRSLLLAFLPAAAGILIMTPVAFWVRVWHPGWERFLGFMAVLPYGLPGTVAAVGLMQLYSGGPLPMAGTPVLVGLAYTVAILPYLYQGIMNSLQTLRPKDLIDAAGLLGSGPWNTFLKVILPALLPGMRSAFLLSFSVLFGEFVLANLLAGGQFETLQIYLYHRLAESGHVSSAVVVVYVAVLGLLALAVFAWGRQPKTADQGCTAGAEPRGTPARPHDRPE